MLPTPAIRRWSMIAFLIAARVPASRSANTNGVNVSSSGSGPIRPVYAAHPFSSSSHTVPRRRTSRYTNRRPSSNVQVRTAYLASALESERSCTTREPVMRGCTTRRCPLASRNTACFARRLTCSKALPRRVRSKRGFETRRSTSVLASRTRAILAPSSRGASSRTIVSTSGSSGTLLLPPTDVATVGFSPERDQLAAASAARPRGRHAVPEPRDGEDPPAVHPQGTVRVAGRPGVEHERLRLEVARNGDRGAALGFVGIARRDEHGCHGGARRHERRLAGAPGPGRDGRQVLGNPREQRQQRLGLGIPEAAVEFQHGGRAVSGEHESGVEDAPIRCPLRRERVDRRLEHLTPYPLEQCVV